MRFPAAIPGRPATLGPPGETSPRSLGWPPFLYLLGEAQHHLGLESPAQHFFMGAKLMPKNTANPKFAKGEVAKIRLEWSQTKASPEPRICGIAGQMLGWTSVIDGLDQYQTHRAPAAAIDSWAMAESFSPEQLQAPFLLTKARSELTRQSGLSGQLTSILKLLPA